MKIADYKPELVDLDDVPVRIDQRPNVWGQRFLAIPEGKAVMLRYNTRQRAHQVRDNIRSLAKYHGFSIHTRIIKAELVIHGVDGWLVYWWKKEE